VPSSHVEFKAWFDAKLAAPDLGATEHGLAMAPLVAFRQPVPAAARGNLAVQNHIIKGRAHRAFPHRMRRGRNDIFFDVVTKAERRRGGTVTPQLRAGASS